MTGIVVVTRAAVEPCTTGELAAQCYADPADAAVTLVLDGYGTAARGLAERHTGRALAARTVTVQMAGFPGGAVPVILPVEPVSAVTAVRYTAADGTLVTMDPAEYQAALGFSPPLLAPAPNTYWPATQCGRLVGVEIDLTLGAVCPPEAKQAILLAVGYWFAHRGDGGDPERDGLPPAALRLLNLLDTGAYR